MRIALISHTGLYWTGLYARSLAADGHIVRVVSFSREPLEDVDVDYVGSGTPSRLKALAYLARVPSVRSRLAAFRPDAVLATYVSSNGLVAALCRPRHLVISAHGSDVLTRSGGAWLHARVMRLACRRAGIVHAVSQPIADELIRCGAAPERIRCFPIGVDVDWFSPSDVRRPSDSPLRVVCTRSQATIYRNDTIVEALGMLRDAGFDLRASLLGGGPLLADRRAHVHALDLEGSVDLPGHVTPIEVRRALQESDIYVSASTSDGASSSLLEAMACGLFPVVSAIPANAAWIEDGVTGLLFEAGDSRALRDAIERAALDGDLRAAAAARNRARVVADGNLALNMRRMERLLDEVVMMEPSA